MNRRSFLSGLSVGLAAFPVAAKTVIDTRIPGPLNEKTYKDWRIEPSGSHIVMTFVEDNDSENVFVIDVSYEEELHSPGSLTLKPTYKSCKRMTSLGPIEVVEFEPYMNIQRAVCHPPGKLSYISREITSPPRVTLRWRELV